MFQPFYMVIFAVWWWWWTGNGDGEKGEGAERAEQRLQRWCDKRFIAQWSPGQLGPLQPLYITSSSLSSSPYRGREAVYVRVCVWKNIDGKIHIVCRESVSACTLLVWLALTPGLSVFNVYLKTSPNVCLRLSFSLGSIDIMHMQMTYQLFCDLNAPVRASYTALCVCALWKCQKLHMGLFR